MEFFIPVITSHFLLSAHYVELQFCCPHTDLYFFLWLMFLALSVFAVGINVNSRREVVMFRVSVTQ